MVAMLRIMTHTYTRISFWRGSVLSQMVEMDLGTRTPHQARRYLRLWFARMAAIETDGAYTVRVQVGSEWEDK